MADTRTIISGPAREINGQIQQRLDDAIRDIDIVSIIADDRGAEGDGTTDDASAIQDANDELSANGGGILRFTPGKIYAASSILPSANVTFDLNGATLKALGGSPNQLFGFNNTLGTSTTLTTGTQGGTSLVVSSSSGFSVGDRIIVSGGTFTGSGSEQGPLEFNTVSAVPDGTHITVKTPLKYSYSAFGLTGASPKVYRLGPETSIVRNVRITNGKIIADSSFDSVYFNFANVERIEIDHVIMDGTVITSNSLVTTGHNLSELYFHDNRSTWGAMNMASLVDSRIVGNILKCPDEVTTGDGFNHMVLEVTCRDNLIANNLIGPIRAVNNAGIELALAAFNNRIIDNRLWGLSGDVTGGTFTLGIRTYTGGPPAGTGNLIIGNHITDIMSPISDISDNSVISGNILINSTSHANAHAIVTNSFKANIGPNTYAGFASATRLFDDGAGGVPTLRSQSFSSTDFEINSGSPESVITAPVGSTCRRKDGGAGTVLYVKESGTGNTGWVAYGGVGVFQPLDSDLTSIAALSTTSFGRGLLTESNASSLRSTAGLVIGTDVQAYQGSVSVTAASFENSWTDYNGSYPTGYWKDRGIVYLQGLVTGGTGSGLVTAFTLPAGYRPGFVRQFTVIDGNTGNPTNMQVDTSGHVQLVVGTIPDIAVVHFAV